jgi:flavin-dependent dehydrogenase
MKSNYDYCIVGAGPSGLTAAYKLLKEGKNVVLIERDSRVGELAKSHDYGG